ncbi:MAG: N-acetylmuramoyl-L-alanine amidase [Candidatus Muirbacterium halophilum]|nr:N-acetylmuramoyl-L-alanine amidase [Candidatus Muirbacterium halophilum]
MFLKRIVTLAFLLLNIADAKSISKCNIAIDIGHSPKSQGAYSATGIGEYNFNKVFAINLYKHLQNKHIGVVFVNPREEELSLLDRSRIANATKATFFLSIHHDSVNKKYLAKNTKLNTMYSNKYKGYSLFVSKKNENYFKSLLLARTIAKKLKSTQLTPSIHHMLNDEGENKVLLDNSGVFLYDNLVVLKNNKIPAVLLEVGVIVNQDEEKKLQDLNYINWYSNIVAKSLEESCKNLDLI